MSSALSRLSRFAALLLLFAAAYAIADAQPASAVAWYGPGTGTAYQLETGLAVVATPGNVSPLTRTTPTNLVANGDMTDNGHANSNPYKWSPVTTNALSGVQMISTPTATTPPTTSMPGWTFTGGGTNTYAMWLPGVAGAVGPWGNGLTQWGPFGSKNGASNPQIYFGNDEGWSISPVAASAGFTAQGVTQTALTWTPNSPATVARNFVSGIAPTMEQAIATTNGNTYCLSFWVGHENVGASVGAHPDGIARVQIGGYNDIYFKVPVANTDERWYTFQFTARSSSTRLAFTSWGHIGSGSTSSTELVLDDVVVNPCSAPTLVGVGDKVWIDANQNGVQDGGELPLQGVTVNLLKADATAATDADGTAVAATTTDASGNYFFGNLLAGSYKVQFTLPSGYVFTSTGGGTGTTDSNPTPGVNPLIGTTSAFAVASSATGDTTASAQPNASFANITIDAGVIPTVGVGDKVWIDANGNGVQDGGEVPLQGVTVELLKADGTQATDAQGTAVAAATSDASGNYFFGNVLPGDYKVRFTLPSNYAFTSTGGGTSATDSNPTPGVNPLIGTTGTFTVAGSATGDTTASVAANARFANITIDAGVFPVVGVGDKVWIDANGNGVQDGGELPLSGVTVNLLKADGTAATDAQGTAVAAATTDASGNYFFGNLLPGDYKVRFTLPNGYAFTSTGAGTSATDSNPTASGNPVVGTTGTFTVAASATGDTTASVAANARFANITIDAGVQQVVGVGDFAWIDADGNGVQDVGEAGLPGVIVQLLDAAGSSPATDAQGNPVGPVTTDANGAYFIGNLLPGTYQAQFTLPSGYTFTSTGAGTGATDSNATPGLNALVGLTGPFTIAASATGDTTASALANARFANHTIDVGAIAQTPPSSGPSGGGSGTSSTSDQPALPGLNPIVPKTQPSTPPRRAVIRITTDTPDPVIHRGERARVVQTGENVSKRMAYDTVIQMPIPPGFTVVNAHGAKIRNGIAYWTIGTLKPGQRFTRTVILVATRVGVVSPTGDIDSSNASQDKDATRIKVVAGPPRSPSGVTG